MQKNYIFWFSLLMILTESGCKKNIPSTDFYAGKWEIAVAETPEVKFITTLSRKNGQLTGELTDATDPSKPKLPITRVEEKANNVSIYYSSAQNKEMAIDLTKVDADNLKGTMYTFDASAKRIK